MARLTRPGNRPPSPSGWLLTGLMDMFSGSIGSSGGRGWSIGPCSGSRRAYLGLKFFVKGKPHFGWARLTVHGTHVSEKATLTGYAYETIPNKPIITGQTKGPDVITLDPGSLGRLAQGSAGRLAK